MHFPSKLIRIAAILFLVPFVLPGCAEEGTAVIEAPEVDAATQAADEAMAEAAEETTDE